jgi:[acyl-carrier-protein] S-malonyltransferase
MGKNVGLSMKIGIIFPGQGSQYLGMCKEIYDRERLVQELFEQASSCVDQNFVRLCFASSDKELQEAINAQTSIFLVSASIYKLLNEKYGIVPSIVAGHSSGEYSAIFAAGGMTFPDALYLLKKRAEFLEEATKRYEGGMLAALGLPFEKVKKICKKYDDPSDLKVVAEIVNYNSPTQFVISGTMPELNAIAADIKEAKGKAIALNVAGAFHSRMMREAEENFTTYLVKVDFKDLTVPLVNNVDAKVVTQNEDIKESLVKQMSSNVLWWPAMQQFKECDLIIEVGPGIKYGKMLKREWPKANIISVNSQADIEQLLTILGKEIPKTEIDLIIEEELKLEQKGNNGNCSI